MGGKKKKQNKKSAKHSKKSPIQPTEVKKPKEKPQNGLFFLHQEQKKREEQKKEWEDKLKPQIVKLRGLRDGKLISIDYDFSEENQKLRMLRWTEPYNPWVPCNWWTEDWANYRQDFAKEMLAPAGSYEIDNELTRDQSNLLYTMIMNNNLIIDESLDTHVCLPVPPFNTIEEKVERTPQEYYEHLMKVLKEIEKYQPKDKAKVEEPNGDSTESDDRNSGSEEQVGEGNLDKGEEKGGEVLEESMKEMTVSTGASFSGATDPEASVGPSGDPDVFNLNVFKYKKVLLPLVSQMSDLQMDASKMASANFNSEATVAPGESETESTKDAFVGSTSTTSTKLSMGVSETLTKSAVIKSGGSKMSTGDVPEEGSSSSKSFVSAVSAENPLEDVAETRCLKKAFTGKASATAKAQKENNWKKTTD